jgi:hypothetical protein
MPLLWANVSRAEAGLIVGIRIGGAMGKSIISVVTGFVTILVAVTSRADDQAEEKAIILKAIRAIGEEAKVKRVKGASWKAKGTFSFIPGHPLPFSEDWVVFPPDRMYRKFETKKGQQVEEGINAFVGDKGWIKTDGQAKEMTKARIAEERVQGYLFWVQLLWPLAEKDFKSLPAQRKQSRGT